MGTRVTHSLWLSVQDVKSTADAAGEEAEDIAHVVRNAAAKGAEDLKEAWDAAKEQIAPITQQPIAETRAEAANYTSNVVSGQAFSSVGTTSSRVCCRRCDERAVRITAQPLVNGEGGQLNVQ